MTDQRQREIDERNRRNTLRWYQASFGETAGKRLWSETLPTFCDQVRLSPQMGYEIQRGMAGENLWRPFWWRY